jgi:hypothetical protein
VNGSVTGVSAGTAPRTIGYSFVTPNGNIGVGTIAPIDTQDDPAMVQLQLEIGAFGYPDLECAHTCLPQETVPCQYAGSRRMASCEGKFPAATNDNNIAKSVTR